MTSHLTIFLSAALLYSVGGEILESRFSNNVHPNSIRSKLIFSNVNNIKDESIIVYSNYLFVHAKRNKTSSAIKVRPSIVFVDPSGNPINNRAKRSANPSGIITDSYRPETVLREVIGSRLTLPLEGENIPIPTNNESEFVAIPTESVNDEKYIKEPTISVTSGIVPRISFPPPAKDLQLPSLQLPPPFLSDFDKNEPISRITSPSDHIPQTPHRPISGPIVFDPEYRSIDSSFMALSPQMSFHEISLHDLPPPNNEPLPFKQKVSDQSFSKKRNFDINQPINPYSIPKFTPTTFLDYNNKDEKQDSEVLFGNTKLPLLKSDCEPKDNEDILSSHIRYADILASYSNKQFNDNVPKTLTILDSDPTFAQLNAQKESPNYNVNLNTDKEHMVPNKQEVVVDKSQNSPDFSAYMKLSELIPPLIEPNLYTAQKRGELINDASIASGTSERQMPQDALRTAYNAIIDEETDDKSDIKIDDYDSNVSIVSADQSESEVPEEPILPLPPLPPNPPPPPPIPKPSKVTQPTLPSTPAKIPSVPIPSVPSLPPTFNSKPMVRPTPPPPPPLNTHPPAIFAPVVPTEAKPGPSDHDVSWLSEEGNVHHLQQPTVTSETEGSVLQFGPTIYSKKVIKTGAEDLIETSYSYVSPDNVPVRISTYKNIPR